METVPLNGKKAAGRVALVDDGDYDLVMQYRWHVREQWQASGRRINGPYAMATIWRDGRQGGLLMHKLITGWPFTDHINHDGLDNQRHNLRPGHGGLNMRNQRAWLEHSSRFKGVSLIPHSGKYRARIQVDHRIRSLGCYFTEEEAALAYDTAARVAFGEYACLNFPDGANSNLRRSW